MGNSVRVDPVPQAENKDSLRSLYMESLQLVERLHRRLLDVIKDEFERNGRSDINATEPDGSAGPVVSWTTLIAPGGCGNQQPQTSNPE